MVSTAALTATCTRAWTGVAKAIPSASTSRCSWSKASPISLALALESGHGRGNPARLGLVNEGDWDDGLPLRVDGYDAFGGIYPADLDFNMYWDDNPEKLERFLRIYDQADYIFISSNRQWGTLPRLPERFPMTTLYYRNLLGCPADKDDHLVLPGGRAGHVPGRPGL